MAKYVAILTIDVWVKDEVYDVTFRYSDDEMNKWELDYNIAIFYLNGKLIGSYSETILSKRFKPLAEVRQEKINQILND